MKIEKTPPPVRFDVVGVGGVGSYFLPAFLRSLRHSWNKARILPTVRLIDGDRLEDKNIERQNYTSGAGKDKVDVMCESLVGVYPYISTVCNYIVDDHVFDDSTFVFCFVDNNLGRKHCLDAVDQSEDCQIVCAANSEVSAHAYYYNKSMKDTPADPRVRWPEINMDTSGSPVVHNGCGSAAVLDESPQTAVANNMAAALSVLMWDFWWREYPSMSVPDDDIGLMVPVEFFSTGGSCGRTTALDLKGKGRR